MYAQCVEGLQSCLLFSQDEAAEPSILMKLYEQATYVRLELDLEKLTNEVVTEFVKDLVELLTEQRAKLEELPATQISQFCFHHMKSFFGDKLDSENIDYFRKADGQNQQQQDQGDEVNDIIMRIELKKF